MHKIIVVLCFLSFILSCNKKTIPADSGKGVTPTGYLYELRKDPYEVVYIKRTSCFGKCPAYEASMMSDGTVKYNGKANVERKGNFEAKINQATINNIVKAAFEIKYFEMANDYPQSGEKLSDLPTTTTSITCTGQSKKIVNKHGAPESLRKFEDMIDTELDKLRYSASSPNTPGNGQ